MEEKSFPERVYDIVWLIPEGRVTNYGSIAKYLGAPRSSRMVGWAMNNAHTVEGIPAHRVVNRIGLLTGRHHFPTPDLMQKQLEMEGLTVVDDKIQDFKTHFWDPNIELL